MVKYVEDNYHVDHKVSPCQPRGQGSDGYGRKIATHHMLRLDNRGPWRRVYATCCSNVASHWITVGDEVYYWKG